MLDGKELSPSSAMCWLCDPAGFPHPQTAGQLAWRAEHAAAVKVVKAPWGSQRGRQKMQGFLSEHSPGCAFASASVFPSSNLDQDVFWCRASLPAELGSRTGKQLRRGLSFPGEVAGCTGFQDDLYAQVRSAL